MNLASILGSCDDLVLLSYSLKNQRNLLESVSSIVCNGCLSLIQKKNTNYKLSIQTLRNGQIKIKIDGKLLEYYYSCKYWKFYDI